MKSIYRLMWIYICIFCMVLLLAMRADNVNCAFSSAEEQSYYCQSSLVHTYGE